MTDKLIGKIIKAGIVGLIPITHVESNSLLVHVYDLKILDYSKVVIYIFPIWKNLLSSGFGERLESLNNLNVRFFIFVWDDRIIIYSEVGTWQ